MEIATDESGEPATSKGATVPSLDFAADPSVVAAVADAARLSFGHLTNPAFATELALIDPLPHQRIAVYEHMLKRSPLRFLLADDAGAGKTVMTGLYLREMIARGLIVRVLVVPPAGLVGNWEREMRTLFRLPFRIATSAEARAGNPFTGPGSDRVIVSIDTLRGERMFARLREAVSPGAARPYDLAVFDEAHKLSARRDQDFTVRKTDRYRLAEALAGLPAETPRWRLGWSAKNILLLTATPHMGKDFPYYCLWRLLDPYALATFDAFEAFPQAQRSRYFIRRTKEEMVQFDSRPLYPQRRCDTLGYELNAAEQRLYDETTDYIAETYNKARILNRSAARLAMSVFQRRLASSTYALMRSFERRLVRLDEAIELVRLGRAEEVERQQKSIGETPDLFETLTADEDVRDAGPARERHEDFEEDALGGLAATVIHELRAERATVKGLLAQARRLAEQGTDSKFDKLRTVMQDPAFAGEKLIVFTEHRDTAEFLLRRLDGLGYTGEVALIHGGLDYREREVQVELFRRERREGGADCLVATDAAGEGINLQFCWRMMNYDLPWNPARLEQRMGRIHRYGQKHDPVVIINLLATGTREGRVLQTLLEKLESIREQLGSDKVFDVVGHLLQDVSLKTYLENAATDEGAEKAIREIGGRLTPEQVRAREERDRARFGGGDVRSRLPELRAAMESEHHRHLLPGYVRRFIAVAAPLVGLRVEGDLGDLFSLVPQRSGSTNPVLDAIDGCRSEAPNRLTVYRREGGSAIWMHPGEPVFEALRDTLLERHGGTALRGAIFVDPYTDTPYLFHLARLSVVRCRPAQDSDNLFGGQADDSGGEPFEVVENRLVGVRQSADGGIKTCPLEHMLLLRGEKRAAPGAVSLARRAQELVGAAHEWLIGNALAGVADEHRTHAEEALPERRRWIARGYNYKISELMEARKRAREGSSSGDPESEAAFAKIKQEQRRLTAEAERHVKVLEEEPSLIRPGTAEFVAHALVLPTGDAKERLCHDAAVERVAMRLARTHEEAAGAVVRDVSRPELAREAGFGDWPGFDLHSIRPARPGGAKEERAIEVKGRARSGGIEVSANEWAKACNLRDRYWLYVVYGCATPHPRLETVQDPFGRLLAKEKGGVTISEGEILRASGDPRP